MWTVFSPRFTISSDEDSKATERGSATDTKSLGRWGDLIAYFILEGKVIGLLIIANVLISLYLRVVCCLFHIYFTPLQACFYGSVQGAFRYGITAPLRRRRRRDPPLPPANQPQPPLQRIEDYNQLAGGDAPQQAPRQRLKQNQIRQRRFIQDREEPPREVESLSRADVPFSDDEVDGEWREGSPVSEHTEQSLSAAESGPQSESESDNQQDTQEKLAGASASSGANTGAEANEAQSKTKPTDSTQEKAKPLKADKKVSRDEPLRNGTEARSQPAQPAQVSPV